MLLGVGDGGLYVIIGVVAEGQQGRGVGFALVLGFRDGAREQFARVFVGERVYAQNVRFVVLVRQDFARAVRADIDGQNVPRPEARHVTPAHAVGEVVVVEVSPLVDVHCPGAVGVL